MVDVTNFQSAQILREMKYIKNSFLNLPNTLHRLRRQSDKFCVARRFFVSHSSQRHRRNVGAVDDATASQSRSTEEEANQKPNVNLKVEILTFYNIISQILKVHL